MDDPPIFFDGWAPIVRTAILTPLAYVALVVLLRVSGKRAIAQMNVFDWVVTVALGSALAALIIQPRVSLAQGVLGIALLLALQFGVSSVTSRSERARRLVTAEPVLVLRDGRLLREAMRRERVAESEVLQALRQSGRARPEEAAAVVLETNGSFTVLANAAPEAPGVPASG